MITVLDDGRAGAAKLSLGRVAELQRTSALYTRGHFQPWKALIDEATAVQINGWHLVSDCENRLWEGGRWHLIVKHKREKGW